jgi:hypothetical protein
MKEHPILFSDPMVRAILDGSKTQTRRVVKPQPYIDEQGNFCWNGYCFGQDRNGPLVQAIASPVPSSKTKRVRCPYGQPGDQLWVREAWRTYASLDDVRPSAIVPGAGIQYEAGGSNVHGAHSLHGMGKLRPSMFMPRWASRIQLEITGIRVERLLDIREDDAMAEGIRRFDDIPVGPMTASLRIAQPDRFSAFEPENTDQCLGTARNAFCNLWESINGPGSCDANPWVWVVEFKVIKP